MNALKSRITSSPSDEDIEEGLHIMRYFSFYKTTPSPLLQSAFEEAFFLTSDPLTKEFPIISPKGVVLASQARLPFAVYQRFVKDLPIVDYNGWTGSRAVPISRKLVIKTALKAVQWVDVTAELSSKTLTESELIELLKVLCGAINGRKLFHTPEQNTLLKNVLKYTPNKRSADEEVIQLSSVTKIVGGRYGNWWHPDCQNYSVAPHVLSYSITRTLDPAHQTTLSSILSLSELSFSEWLAHVIEHHLKVAGSTNDQNVAIALLNIVASAARHIQFASNIERDAIYNHLRTNEVIPTSVGLRKPAEVYYTTLHHVPEIPVLKYFPGASGRNMKRLLAQLDVKPYLSVEIILDRFAFLSNPNLKLTFHQSRDARNMDDGATDGLPRRYQKAAQVLGHHHSFCPPYLPRRLVGR
jgi:hypothetical protein